jgi:hypothetical protein
MYDIEVIFNIMASLMNIIKICQLVQKLLKVNTQTDRGNGDIIAPVSSLNLNSVNQLIFVMVKCGVLFEVRTELWNKILPSLSQAFTTHHPNVFTPILPLSE